MKYRANFYLSALKSLRGSPKSSRCPECTRIDRESLLNYSIPGRRDKRLKIKLEQALELREYIRTLF